MSEEDLASPGRIGLVEETFRVKSSTADLRTRSSGNLDAAFSLPAVHELDASGAADTLLLPVGYTESSRNPSVPSTLDLAAAIATINDMFDDAEAGAANSAPPGVPAVRPPSRGDAPRPGVAKRNSRHGLIVATIVCALLATIGWHFAGVSDACRTSGGGQIDLAGRSVADAVARRIVTAESSGDATASNKLSSATGSGQFLDGTWLEMIRAYRPDLAGRSDTEILDLRGDPDLSREMVARFAEQNAAMLVSRCLPVTPGSLYLSHFAGGAGAAAVLSAPENADAAATMAKADSTGRTTRDMIVTANPFLKRFTVADLKRWADRKMGVAGGDRFSRM